MNKNLYSILSEEQILKARDRSNNEESLYLTKKEGTKLSKERLFAISGGGYSQCLFIPEGDRVWMLEEGGEWKCLNCGNSFHGHR